MRGGEWLDIIISIDLINKLYFESSFLILPLTLPISAIPNHFYLLFLGYSEQCLIDTVLE